MSAIFRFGKCSDGRLSLEWEEGEPFVDMKQNELVTMLTNISKTDEIPLKFELEGKQSWKELLLLLIGRTSILLEFSKH